MNSVDIYLENYVPVYGVSFKLDLSQLEIQGDGDFSFEDGFSGRAEESNWTVSTNAEGLIVGLAQGTGCLLYTSPSPRDKRQSRMPSSA